jgi:SIR2-like domain
MTPDELAAHYVDVVDALLSGGVVPFLGAGANLCGRPADAHWVAGASQMLPSGGELAEHLAARFRYPASDKHDLARVAQYVVVQRGARPLYSELHQIFCNAWEPNPLHRFLARVPRALREHGSSPHLLIVTTNYDDALESAFRERGELFDLVWYIAEGKDERRGKFLWQSDSGPPELITRPNEASELTPEDRRRSIILKIHGDAERTSPPNLDRDSYVITEDDYIDYLTRSTDPSNIIPVGLVNKMRESAFLFLGYSLRDWNLRVILYRLWREQTLGTQSWAIQRRPHPFEKKFWSLRGVEVLDIDLDEYVAGLTEALANYPSL